MKILILLLLSSSTAYAAEDLKLNSDLTKSVNDCRSLGVNNNHTEVMNGKPWKVGWEHCQLIIDSYRKTEAGKEDQRAKEYEADALVKSKAIIERLKK